MSGQVVGGLHALAGDRHHANPRAEADETVANTADETAAEATIEDSDESSTQQFFTGHPDSAYNFESKEDAELSSAFLFAKVEKSHPLQVKEEVRRWVEKHTKNSKISPLEKHVLEITLRIFLEEAKVKTKLTEYGTRFLLVLTAGENILENASDIGNLINLYIRGEHVFFGLSLACSVSSF